MYNTGQFHFGIIFIFNFELQHLGFGWRSHYVSRYIINILKYILLRLQVYTEELYKIHLHDPDYHDGMITHLEPDILECESSGP